MARTQIACTTINKTAAILTSVMATTGLAQAADSASVIYAAENALYGVGLDIGQADGWMDGALRSAIRQYQSRHGDLSTNGTLDAATLEALGIAHAPAKAISENHLGSAKAARLALNLPITSVPAVRFQPEPVATQPETADEARREPTEPVPVVASAEPADTDEQAPRPEERDVQIIAQSQPAEPARPVVAPEPVSELPKEPPSAGPVSPPVASADPMPVDEPPLAAQPAPVATTVVTAPPSVEPRESRGGFLASLFDFLFGWLI